ncbi:MAG: AAA family ATPase [Tepidisphaeraceae bacterium]
MIRAISIKNLRGIREGELNDLTPLVILVGPNNCGKSTVLDAIYLGASAAPDNGLGDIARRRSQLPDPWRWLFYRDKNVQDQPADVAIMTDRAGAAKWRRLRLTPPAPNNWPGIGTMDGDFNNGVWTGTAVLPTMRIEDVASVRLIDAASGSVQREGQARPLAEIYTDAAERGALPHVREILIQLLPNLRDLDLLAPGNRPTVYLQFANRMHPVELAGDGVQALLRQVLELASPAGSVVLMEEPEVHMHPAAMRQAAKAILAAVRQKVQVILTTHSLEFIDLLLAEAAESDLGNLSTYSLALRDGQLIAVRRNGEDTRFSRQEIGGDLR